MKKNILLHLILFCLLITKHSPAQVSSLDSLILAQMATSHTPGLSALILKKGIPVWMNNYGYAHLDDSIPVISTTDFSLASISKTITVTAVMNMYENGSFQLDDNINDYLPFTVDNPYFPDDTITFRQLLTHTSSIRDNWVIISSLYTIGDSPIPLGEFMQDYMVPGGQYYDADKNFFNYPPQTEYNYCNEAVALAGYIVETITGVPFDQYCNDSIFTPLCMDETSWFLSGLDTANIAMPYHWQGGAYQAVGYYGYPDYPDGQLRTNAIALARFLAMYMNHGKYNDVRILDSTTVNLIFTIQFPAIESTQGIIWYKFHIGERICWGHDGGDLGVSTNMYFSPDDTTGIILLSNGESFYSSSVMDAMFDYAESIEPLPGSTFDCEGIPTAAQQLYLNEDISISIFPNPSEGIFQVNTFLPSGSRTEIAIYDVMGSLVVQKILEQNKTTLDLSNQPNGIYLVQMKGGDKKIWSKLVKQ